MTDNIEIDKMHIHAAENMKRIILDTDFLIMSLKWRVDVFSELTRICDFPYKVYVLDKTIDELKGKKLENLALSFIESKIGVIKTGIKKPVDEILFVLDFENLVVCTQDAELKEKLKKGKIPVITIRQKKYLIWEK